MQKATIFFMFDGKAEEAMNFYVSLFEHAEVRSISRYPKDGPGKEGTVMHAVFSIQGQEFMCIDSPVSHSFTFTPAISIYISCITEPEIDLLFEKVSPGGQIFMPLQKYPFSNKFGWITDKYGVSWQLNLTSP
jgi:predicted 3-demethylubiquinone-9 3-methyltransferase (glyoxalase superfamily)